MRKKVIILCCLIIAIIVTVITITLKNQEATQKTQMMFLSGWQQPPAYNGNPFTPGADGDYKKYIYGNLASYRVLDGTIKPYLAESIYGEDNKLTIKIKEGISWNDGVPLTSKDIKANFVFKHAFVGMPQVWNYLDSIDTPDDKTTVFNFKEGKKTQLSEIYILTDKIIVPYHKFEKYMEGAEELFNIRERKAAVTNKLKDSGMTQEFIVENKDWIALNNEFSTIYTDFRNEILDYKPEYPLTCGPYKVSKVTPTNMILDKVETFPNNDKNTIDQIILSKWASNELNWASLSSGLVDVIGVAAPPDVVDALTQNEGVKHILTSTFGSIGLYLNTEKYPFSDIRFRKALAYIIDRDKCRELGAFYGTTIEKQSGILESIKDIWIDDSEFESYSQDFDKAEELLKEMGMTKNASGFWCDKSGKELNFSIYCDQGRSDWTVMADETSRTLSSFGIKTNVKILESTIYTEMVIHSDDYDMTIDRAIQSPRAPYQGFRELYKNGGFGYKFSRFNPVVEGPDGKIIVLEKLTTELGETVDIEKQKELLQILASATNTYLPYIDYYEAKSQIFINDSVRVDGWPNEEELKIGLASDKEENIMMWLLEGKLKAKGK